MSVITESHSTRVFSPRRITLALATLTASVLLSNSAFSVSVSFGCNFPELTFNVKSDKDESCMVSAHPWGTWGPNASSYTDVEIKRNVSTLFGPVKVEEQTYIVIFANCLDDSGRQYRQEFETTAMQECGLKPSQDHDLLGDFGS